MYKAQEPHEEEGYRERGKITVYENLKKICAINNTSRIIRYLVKKILNFKG